MAEVDILPEIIVRRVLQAGPAEKIVLFGSRGRGRPRRGSDYDILIVQPSSLPRARRSGIYYRALSDLPIEADVVVVTPEEIHDWERVPQAFITTALREGRTLYERQA